ncbi:MAG: formylglycine-generating enzyme family protein [Verrucomicrobiota bacterium]
MTKRTVQLLGVLSVIAAATGFPDLARAQDKPGAIAKVITNSIGMKLVLIPAGEFLMGTMEGEKEQIAREKNPQLRVQRTQPFFAWRDGKEFPQHKVRISRAFYLGDTEVTQGQWKAIMGSNPSDFKGDDLPVEHVTWRACVTFAQKLSEKEGKKYRLPTEAEWEYACRAGSTTAYYFGDDPALLGEYEWFAANSQGKTHPVGEKKPNAWGLYDMQGNVKEWCDGYFGEYPKETVTDPTGGEEGERPVRGRDWSNTVTGKCRSAYRSSHDPSYGTNIQGCRVMMDPVSLDQPKKDK